MAATNQSNDSISPVTTPDLPAIVLSLQSELAAVKARLDALEVKSHQTDERRQFPRLPVKVAVRLLTWRQHESPIVGEVVDLSKGGFGLFSDTVFVVESYLTVTPAYNPLGPRFEARVTSRILVGPQWRIGCEFVQHLTDKELQIFYDSDSPTNPSE
ncbi:MAG: hypothetical protein C0467_31395 [Planctomycetaceae bacterium]|nr:hypothetical protein [Planctomycetaceae bacterium]